MSSKCPMRLGSPLKNQTCEQGDASSMWPRRSRRTRDSVTSTPHLSQMTPRCFIRLYLPQTFPVGDGTEDAGAKQPVALRLEGAVIDGFRLGDFPMRPASDLFRRGETDPDGIEVGDQICSVVRRGSVHNFSYKSFKAADERRFTQIRSAFIRVNPRLINLLRERCPGSLAASSSTPHPDTATATRGSGR